MSQNKKILSIILLLAILPFLLFAIQKVTEIRKRAAPIPANIFIDTTNLQGPLNSAMWQNFSQGGEESKNMIDPVISQLQTLSPKLIRIDHIFDYYSVYQSPGQYNFSQLDQTIDSITSTGAIPMLSLSYTPSSMSKDNQNAGEPKNWDDWFQLVKATAKHYSVEKNINNIYYEVWNEPDLFGHWHYSKNPSYTTLYIQTAKAVSQGINNQSSYKIGGPATTAFYDNWIKSLFKTAKENNLRLDFISWHRYSKNISDYLSDSDQLTTILSDYPEYFRIERIITETGPNSEPDAWYDNNLGAIHLLSLATQLSGKIHKFFTFEIVDGPTTRSKDSSGWGLITHSTNGQISKPRFFAIQFLNQLLGQRLSSVGDGNYITSLSTKNINTIQTLIVNYDPNNLHYETFPITYKNLQPGKYQLKYNSFLKSTLTKTIIVTGDSYSQQFYLEPNTSQIIELTPQ